MASKWNKYNIKSSRPSRGKEGSEYYKHLQKAYPEEADQRYKDFKYHQTHGQKTINNQIND